MRILSLSSLRFFAAFYVLLYHYLPVFFPNSFSLEHQTPFASFIFLGYSAVPFFFLLSGFVLTYTYENRPTTRSAFWLKRFFRLFPVMFLSLLFGLVPLWFGLRRELGNDFVALKSCALDFFINATFLGAWIPGTGRINYPIWSLSVEAFFYLCFPFLLSCLRTKDRQQSVKLLFLTYAFALVIPYVFFLFIPEMRQFSATRGGAWDNNNPHALWYSILDVNPLIHLATFLAGMILGHLELRKHAWERKFLWGIVLAFSFVLVFSHESISYFYLHSGLCIPFFASILLLGIHSKHFRILLENKPLILLGESSYALYILHVPLRNHFLALVNKFGLGKVAVFPFLVFLFILFVVSFSVFIFKTMEEPTQRWWRNKSLSLKQS